MKMTRAEYLVRHGWVEREDGFAAGGMEWLDPKDAGNNCQKEDAITVQLARDAEEERELHRAVVAARMSIGHAARDGGMVRAFGANVNVMPSAPVSAPGCSSRARR